MMVNAGMEVSGNAAGGCMHGGGGDNALAILCFPSCQ